MVHVTHGIMMSLDHQHMKTRKLLFIKTFECQDLLLETKHIISCINLLFQARKAPPTGLQMSKRRKVYIIVSTYVLDLLLLKACVYQQHSLFMSTVQLCTKHTGRVIKLKGGKECLHAHHLHT